MKRRTNHRRSVLAGTVAVLLAAGIGNPTEVYAQQQAPSVVPAGVEAPVLSRAQIDALLAKPGEVLFLDVRRADEIGVKGGFPVFLSVQLAQLERFLPFIPRDRTIVPVSNHAGRAKKAASLLTANGFRVAGVAGVDGYAAEGGTLVGQKPADPATSGSVASQPR
jgi:gluconolactonase